MNNQNLNGKTRGSKLKELNYNLKNVIFSFLGFEEIINNLLKVNKSFCNSIKKIDFICVIKDNDLLNKPTLISFSKEKIQNFKSYFSHEKFSEYEEIINQIYLYLLEKKYSKLKKLFLTL